MFLALKCQDKSLSLWEAKTLQACFFYVTGVMGWEAIYTLPIQAQHKGVISHFNIPMATVMLVVRCVVETQAHVQGDHTERLTVMFEPTTFLL